MKPLLKENRVWKKDKYFFVNKHGYRINRILVKIYFYTILLGMLFLMVGMYSNPQQQYYVGCPGENQCQNPFYQSTYCYDSNWRYIGMNEWLSSHNLCEKEFLFPGESYGGKPNWFVQNLTGLLVGWSLIFSLGNHFLYNKNFDGGKDDEDNSNTKND